MIDTVHKDVISFAKLEKELSLFDRSYNGFFYWQHIRFFVCESLFGNRASNEKQEKKIHRRSFMDILFKIFISFVEAIKIEMFFIAKNECNLVFLRENKLKDRFFDSWTLPKDISIMNCYTIPYFKNNKDGVYFAEWPSLKSEVEDKLRRNFKSYKTDIQEKKFLINLEKRLLNIFGQSITADDMEALIHKYAVLNRHYSKFYSRLFYKTKCDAIVCTCYYSNYLLPALRIAKEKDISVIEFQHGVINSHEEYWFEDDRGINNYTPDYLLTFGEIHNSWIKLVRGEKAIAVGYPFQEMSIQSLYDIVPDDKEIVVYPESDSRFEKTIEIFINDITPKGYHVIIKIHPVESKNVEIYYPLLSNNPNAEIVTSQKEGIYYWLKRAKHHIMASTTVGLEAVAFDHSNVCIATHVPHDQVQCLLDCGIARGFSTSKELVNLILDPIDLKTKEAKRIRRELWSENPASNMTLFFENLKQNGWKV